MSWDNGHDPVSAPLDPLAPISNSKKLKLPVIFEKIKDELMNSHGIVQYSSHNIAISLNVSIKYISK